MGQAVGVVEAKGQYVLRGQAVQAALPPTVLYVPAAHAAHADPSAPV
jgi:hypothetical protein